MDEGTDKGTQTGAGTGEAPAWVAQLPADMREDQSFHAFKTIGDLAKDHQAMSGKVKELDGLKTKLENSIPKLTEDATEEEKNIYYLSLGRPEKVEGYEFAGDGLDPKSVSFWQGEMFKAGLSKEQGKAMSAAWNGYMKQVIDSETAQRTKERTEAEGKLKAELGDKYDGAIELTRRVWKKYSNSEFDQFVNETKIGNDPRLIRFMVNLAKITGEDTSPPGSTARQNEGKPGIVYDHSPAPPAKPY